MREKIYSYLGFAKKSGNLATGYNTCSFTMKRGKIKLLIIAEDISQNTLKKIINEAKSNNTPYRVYGNSELLSHAVGSSNRSIFGITDQNFARVILKEIDQGKKPEKEGI